jgi:hypothetical protein
MAHWHQLGGPLHGLDSGNAGYAGYFPQGGFAQKGKQAAGQLHVAYSHGFP